jgi:hypothetical protein
MHRCVAGHSRSSLQSTQNPSSVEQTWPGHDRDVVHRTTATHAPRRHTRSPEQSDCWLQPTQRPRAVLHTRPSAEHSRSDVHETVPAASSDDASSEMSLDGSERSVCPASAGIMGVPSGEQAAPTPTIKHIRISAIRIVFPPYVGATVP